MILRIGKITGIMKNNKDNVFSLGLFILTDSSLFLMKASIKKGINIIYKLGGKEIVDNGISIPMRGKAQFIYKPPNIKKPMLEPIV